MAIRDKLLVKAGAKAEVLYSGGVIRRVDDDILADRIIKMVDLYIERGMDENFDNYIEVEIAMEFAA